MFQVCKVTPHICLQTTPHKTLRTELQNPVPKTKRSGRGEITKGLVEFFSVACFFIEPSNITIFEVVLIKIFGFLVVEIFGCSIAETRTPLTMKVGIYLILHLRLDRFVGELEWRMNESVAH